MSFPIVGKRFTPAEFAEYVDGVTLAAGFRPSIVVLHNTAVPSLSQRPHGFTEQHMRNLQTYYAETQRWSGGPHLFVDDQGIWVFNPLDRRGTHSPSWNAFSYGVEMLGNYETEPFNSGRGAKVRDNAAQAVAILLRKRGLQANNTTIKLHKEDTATTHDCPGANANKAAFVGRVVSILLGDAQKPAEGAVAPSVDSWVVQVGGRTRQVPHKPTEGDVTGMARMVAESLGARVSVEGKRITITVGDPAADA